MKSKKVSRVSEVNTNRINKRKYYGVGVEIKEIEESFEYHFNHTAVIDQLRDSLVSIESVSEDFEEEIVAATAFLRDDADAVVEDLEEPLSNSYEKGTRRAFNTEGDTLPPPDDIDKRVNEILQEQKNYISKLDSDLRQKARQIIRNGVRKGLAKTKIIENLREELKNLIDNRKSTIAESEAVAAAGAGVAATFDYNGVEKVMWVTEIDESTCEPGAFRVSYNGETYTTCRHLHEKTFDRTGNHPKPVEDTHANCRCLLVANNADV